MSAKKSRPVHDEIIRLYLLRYNYTQIAAKLGIDRGTVAVHVNEFEAERENAAVARALEKAEKAKERTAPKSKASSGRQPVGQGEGRQTSLTDEALRQLLAEVKALRGEVARQAAELDTLRRLHRVGDQMPPKSVPVSSVEPLPVHNSPVSAALDARHGPSDPPRPAPQPAPQPMPARGPHGSQAMSGSAGAPVRSRAASLDLRTATVAARHLPVRQLDLFPVAASSRATTVATIARTAVNDGRTGSRRP